MRKEIRVFFPLSKYFFEHREEIQTFQDIEVEPAHSPLGSRGPLVPLEHHRRARKAGKNGGQEESFKKAFRGERGLEVFSFSFPFFSSALLVSREQGVVLGKVGIVDRREVVRVVRVDGGTPPRRVVLLKEAAGHLHRKLGLVRHLDKQGAALPSRILVEGGPGDLAERGDAGLFLSVGRREV
jgi:hypothetical protein